MADGTLQETPDRILVMGAGNDIMGDEGIGPRCIAELDRQFTFPDNVELINVGTTGLGILDTLRDFDRLVIIDAAQETGHDPGTVILFDVEDLAGQQVMHSMHDMRLVDVLKAAAMVGIELKSVDIVAVQVERIAEWVMELSEPVEEAVPVACAAALQTLSSLGVVFVPEEGVDTDPRLLDAYEHFGPEPEDVDPDAPQAP